MTRPEPQLAAFGFLLLIGLAAWRVTGAVIIAILATTLLGMILGVTAFGGAILSLPPDPRATFLAMDVAGALQIGLVTTVFAFLFMDLFDTAGTLVGVAHRAGLQTPDGRLPRLKRALLADSLASVAGAALGISTVTSYIESAAGTNIGGRTGLTALVAAILFLAALFLAPLAANIPPYATTPALLYVACLMTRGLVEVDWEDVTEFAPAVIVALTMPLTYSIAHGIAMVFIAYAGIKLISGRRHEINAAVLILALLFLIKFAIV